MMQQVKEPLVSIIIPTYNSPKTLRQCLISILASNFPLDNFEVIVVDHGLKEHTKKVVKGFPVKYIPQKDPGLASARNNGILASKGSIIVFVDDDVSVPSNWLKKIKKAFDQDKELSCIGGLDIHFNTDSYFGKCIRIQENFFKQHFFILKDKNLKLKGCNMAFRSEVFTEIGLFETKRIYYHREDANFISRIKKANKKIKYDDTLYLYHHTPNLRKFINTHIIGHKESHETYGKTYFIHYLAFIALSLAIITLFIFPFIIYPLIFIIIFGIFYFCIVICIKMNEGIEYTPGIFIILIITLFFIYTKAIYSIFHKNIKIGGFK